MRIWDEVFIEKWASRYRWQWEWWIVEKIDSNEWGISCYIRLKWWDGRWYRDDWYIKVINEKHFKFIT